MQVFSEHLFFFFSLYVKVGADLNIEKKAIKKHPAQSLQDAYTIQNPLKETKENIKGQLKGALNYSQPSEEPQAHNIIYIYL